jgi:NDP-sugar pyrophosphorylase family protein
VNVVLFCGGQGLRRRGYVDAIAKPMVPTGEPPILWHPSARSYVRKIVLL